MQYLDILKVAKNENFSVEKKNYIFPYFCSKHRLLEHVRTVLTSTRNLSFVAKIRKTGIPFHTAVLLYKSGVYGGIHCTDMFS